MVVLFYFFCLILLNKHVVWAVWLQRFVCLQGSECQPTLLLAQRGSWQNFVKKRGRVFGVLSQLIWKSPRSVLLGLFLGAGWDWAWCLQWCCLFISDSGQRLCSFVASAQALENCTLLWSRQAQCLVLWGLHHRLPIPATVLQCKYLVSMDEAFTRASSAGSLQSDNRRDPALLSHLLIHWPPPLSSTNMSTHEPSYGSQRRL